MTVAELIEKLKSEPPEAVVIVGDRLGHQWHPLSRVDTPAEGRAEVWLS